jgi:hypothetical protein
VLGERMGSKRRRIQFAKRLFSMSASKGLGENCPLASTLPIPGAMKEVPKLNTRSINLCTPFNTRNMNTDFVICTCMLFTGNLLFFVISERSVLHEFGLQV